MYTGTRTHTSLIARLTEGNDESAWGEFCTRYADLIRGCCARRGLQIADADDVRQEVLLGLSKSMPGFRYDPEKGRFRSYLKAIVMRAISRRLCQNVPGAGLPGVSESRIASEEHEEAVWEDEWRQYHFRRAMATIEVEFSEKDRRAFTMYAVGGRDAAGIARDLSMSVDAVYQSKSRILKRLSALIEAQVAEEG